MNSQATSMQSLPHSHMFCVRVAWLPVQSPRYLSCITSFLVKGQRRMLDSGQQEPRTDGHPINLVQAKDPRAAATLGQSSIQSILVVLSKFTMKPKELRNVLTLIAGKTKGQI